MFFVQSETFSTPFVNISDEDDSSSVKDGCRTPDGYPMGK